MTADRIPWSPQIVYHGPVYVPHGTLPDPSYMLYDDDDSMLLCK